MRVTHTHTHTHQLILITMNTPEPISKWKRFYCHAALFLAIHYVTVGALPCQCKNYLCMAHTAYTKNKPLKSGHISENELRWYKMNSSCPPSISSPCSTKFARGMCLRSVYQSIWTARYLTVYYLSWSETALYPVLMSRLHLSEHLLLFVWSHDLACA